MFVDSVNETGNDETTKSAAAALHQFILYVKDPKLRFTLIHPWKTLWLVLSWLVAQSEDIRKEVHPMEISNEMLLKYRTGKKLVYKRREGTESKVIGAVVARLPKAMRKV